MIYSNYHMFHGGLGHGWYGSGFAPAVHGFGWGHGGGVWPYFYVSGATFNISNPNIYIVINRSYPYL